MNSDSDAQTTSISREDNPKAVFYGGSETFIQPLALYLHRKNVDLFAAKELSDAFFGNYFLCIGDGDGVKTFVEQRGKELPKSLFLIDAHSDYQSIYETIKKWPHIKMVVLDITQALDEKGVRRLMEFFFASPEQLLLLSTPVNRLSTKPAFSEKSKVIESLSVKLPGHEEEDFSGSANEPLSILSNEQIEMAHKPNDGFVSTTSTTSTVSSFFSDDKEEKKKKGHRFRWAAGSLVVILIFIFFPLILVAAEFALGGIALSRAYKSIEKKNLDSASEGLKGAHYFFTAAKRHLEVASPVFSLLRLRTAEGQLVLAADTGMRVANGSTELLRAAKDGELLLTGIVKSDKTISYGQLLSSIKGSLTLSDSEMGIAEAQLKSPTMQTLLNGSVGRLLPISSDQFTRQLGQMRTGIGQARQAVALLPELTGFYGKRTLLVVLQNNMELRPTGGFIGSYGLLTFEEGWLKDLKIEDVYTADGALEGHVEPPEPIKTHLSQEHWYMRDSNWNPDFSEAGARLAWFIEKEIDVEVDGVIALDLTFAKYLLEVTGPVELADFQTTVTADNLFHEAHERIEANFFPGSTHKRDFLTSLGTVLIEKVLKNPHISSLSLAEKVYQSLSERHLLVYMINPTTQSAIEILDWAGTQQVAANCTPPRCVSDYLMIVNANLGVNKANYYVEQKVKDVIQIQPDKIIHQLTLTYKNDSPEESKVGGFYKNYVRVYAPTESKLIEATVEGEKLALIDTGVASSSAALTAHENELAMFAGWLEVPPKREQSITFVYEMPFSSGGDEVRYVYKVQKQPGTTADKLEMTLQYPNGWQLISNKNGEGDVAGASSLENQDSISYNTSLERDRELTFSIFK